MERHQYEGELADVVAREKLSSIPYFALASGFLTGKYRPGAKIQSQRAQTASAYLNEKGIKVLAALDEVATAHNVAAATVALAWLRAQPTVVAPIASARTTEQLPDLLSVSHVQLSDGELRKLKKRALLKGATGPNLDNETDHPAKRAMGVDAKQSSGAAPAWCRERPG